MQQTITFTVTIPYDAVVQVVPNPSMPPYTPNVPYPATSIATVTGGVGPYTFAATNLPAGFNLSSTGVLSGTPTGGSGPLVLSCTLTDSGTP